MIPEGGAEGVIATHGGRFNGWGLYLLGGKPVFHYNLAGVQRYPSPPRRSYPGGNTSSWWTSSTTAAASARAAR